MYIISVYILAPNPSIFMGKYMNKTGYIGAKHVVQRFLNCDAPDGEALFLHGGAGIPEAPLLGSQFAITKPETSCKNNF